jgi:hypothetical protein
LRTSFEGEQKISSRAIILGVFALLLAVVAVAINLARGASDDAALEGGPRICGLFAMIFVVLLIVTSLAAQKRKAKDKNEKYDAKRIDENQDGK